MGVRARPMAWWELASVSRADRIADGAAKAIGTRRAYAEACISARASLGKGDPGSAISTLEPIVAELPAAIDAHRLLGIALLDSGDQTRARRSFEVALEGDPIDLVAQVGVAEVEEATEGLAVAFRAWRRAWEMEPGYEPVSARLREIRRQLLAEGSANTPLTTDGSLDGPIAHTYASLARARLRAGLHHHAVLDAVEALRQDRTRVDIQLLLAEAWWRSGETEVAHDVAASILETTPNCVTANLLVAVHRRAVSRDSRQQVERARQADPFDRIAHQLFAGRDVPPIMEDAWSGDQWSASRAAYGEWPVVAVMPRAVAVVRAQLAAEKAAAEAAEQARLEAEAAARRQKAAEEAAKKPGAGAFKGTGIISDTPAKPAPDKADGAASAPPPKPAGFKGSGVIAEEEPVAKSKSRRPPPPPGGEAPAEVSPPPAPADPPTAPPSPVADLAPSVPASAGVASGAPDKPADSPSAQDSPSPQPQPDSPTAPAPVESPTAGQRAADAQNVMPTLPAPPVAEPPPANADPNTKPPSGPSVGSESGRASAIKANGMVTQDTNDRQDPTSPPLPPHVAHTENGTDELPNSLGPDEGGVNAPPKPTVQVPLLESANGFDSNDVHALRSAADASFHRRRYTEAVRMYAAVLRRT